MATTGAAAVGGGPGPSGPRKEYEYHTLAAVYDDISRSGAPKKVYRNVYARVVECSNVRETRGYSQDKMVNLRLADATTAGMGYEDGVELLCFCPEEERLPVPFSPGDVIRLHRVSVGEWNGRLQLVGKVAGTDDIKKSPFSYALFHHAEVAGGGECSPYKYSSQTYNFGAEDLRQLAALKAQGEPAAKVEGETVGKVEGERGAAAASSEAAAPAAREAAAGGKLPEVAMRKISEIESAGFNLTCKVLHVEHEDELLGEGGEGGGGQPLRRRATTLYVWDGTDARPEPLSSDNSEHLMELYADNPLVGDRLDLSAGLLKALDPASVEARFGTILPVRVCSRLAPAVAGVAAGQWISLIRVRAMVLLGQLQGLYTEESRWAPHAEQPQLLAAAGHKAARNEVCR